MSGKEIISFKGTRRGILMSILEQDPFGRVMEELKIKVENDIGFFRGSAISLDLGWREIDDDDMDELLGFVKENNLQLQGIISSSLNTRRVSEARGLKVIIGRLGLADHHGRTKLASKSTYAGAHSATSTTAPRQASSTTAAAHEPVMPQDETLLIRKTVRSGQSIQHHGNVVIHGDVNPGAEVKAGGDIIIIGALRGIAHAGRKAGLEPVSITALKFQPTQIRIREQIDSNIDSKIIRQKMPVTAEISNGKIEYKIHK